MGTKVNTLSSSLSPIFLNEKEQGSQIIIDVPAGEALYVIEQHGPEDQTFVFNLRHPGTQLFLRGLIQAEGESAPRLITKVIHHAPHTQADTLMRTLVRDKAQPRYEGLIQIAENAQDCESYLNHHSLVLSPTATSWSIPSLEIKANQVKCSHAATIRTITELDLFYARSRGIDAGSAREMLIEAFISDIPVQEAVK